MHTRISPWPGLSIDLQSALNRCTAVPVAVQTTLIVARLTPGPVPLQTTTRDQHMQRSEAYATYHQACRIQHCLYPPHSPPLHRYHSCLRISISPPACSDATQVLPPVFVGVYVGMCVLLMCVYYACACVCVFMCVCLCVCTHYTPSPLMLAQLSLPPVARPAAHHPTQI